MTTPAAPANSADAVHILQVFADPIRLRILHLLHHAGELCAGDIGQVLGVPQPTASRHLARLRKSRLVRARQIGLWVYYEVAAADSCLGQVLLDCLGRCLSEASDLAADRRRLVEIRRAGGCCAPAPAPGVVPVKGVVPRVAASRRRAFRR